MTSKNRIGSHMLSVARGIREALATRLTFSSVTVAVTLIALLTPTLSLVSVRADKPNRSTASTTNYEIVLHVNHGSQVFRFPTRTETDDGELRGPTSLSITESGNFLVVNQADNSVVELSKTDGAVIAKTVFADVRALTDAFQIAGRIYAIDANNAQPRIVESDAAADAQALGEPGSRQMQVHSNTVAEIREDELPTRLSMRDGRLAVETISGEIISALDGVTKVRRDKRTPVIAPGNPFLADANRLRVSIRGKERVNLELPNPIAETELLGVLDSGEFLVYVIELSGEEELLLDHTVLHFSAGGELINQARVPAYERAFAIPNGTALAQDGVVYSLIARDNGDVDIVRLTFVESLPKFSEVVKRGTPPEGGLQTESISIAALTTPELTRAQIQANARNIVNSTVWHTIANIGTSASCPTRVIPAYLRGRPAGSYQIAYSWGGADTPTGYQSKLGGGSLAGNAQQGYTNGCNVAGDDCSGFIGNVWQMWNHPFSTSSLPGSGAVRSIPWSTLMSGDVLNRAGVHIMMYDRSDSNSLWVWEATTDYGTGRVGYNQRPWRDVPSTSYAAWRYNGLPKPIARFYAISSWGVQSEGSYGTYTVSPGQSIRFSFDSGRSVPNSSYMAAWKWRVNGTLISTQSSTSYTLGAGTHVVSLEVTNSEGSIASASATIQINQVVIVLAPRIDLINPSYVRFGQGTWLGVYGGNFQSSMRVQVRTPSGTWPIASSGVSFVNSGFVWVWVQMGGSARYTAWLDIVQNGYVASRSFTVGP